MKKLLEIPYEQRRDIYRLPKKGEVYAKDGQLLGRWVCLQYSYEQHYLDRLCRSWLETYKQDSRFFLTVDFETQGLDPHNNEIVLASISWDEEHSVVVILDNFDLTLLKEVFRTVKISNQNVKFDSKFSLGRLGVKFNIYFDVLTGSQLAYCGKLNLFNLGALSRSLLNIILEKEESKETTLDFTKMVKRQVDGHWVWVARTPKDRRLQDFHIEYAAQDTIIAHRLTKVVISQLVKDDLYKLWRECELPLVRYFVGLEYDGVPIDKAVAQNYYNEIETLLLDLKKKIAETVGTLTLDDDHKKALNKANGSLTINPLSSAQIIKICRVLGVRLKDTTKDHLLWHVSNEKDEKIRDFIDAIRLYRLNSTKLTKYLKPWLTTLSNPKTGRIHYSVRVIASNGATGRAGASDPNIMAVEPVLRPVVIARPGYKIITQDYSQYEIRAGAAYSGEQTLLDAFFTRAKLLPDIEALALKHKILDPDTFVKEVVEGKDFGLTVGEVELTHEFSNTDIHKRVASIVYGKPTWEIDKKERTVSKCVDLETKVYTDKGVMTLRNLLPKKLVPDTFYKPKKKIKVMSDEGYQEIGQVYYSGKHKALKVTTNFGREITCSLQHKFRVLQDDNYNWIEAQHLSVGNHLVIKQEPKSSTFNLEAFCFGWYYSNEEEDPKIIKIRRHPNVKKYLDSSGIKYKEFSNYYQVKTNPFLEFADESNASWWRSFALGWLASSNKTGLTSASFGKFTSVIYHAMSYLGYRMDVTGPHLLVDNWELEPVYCKRYCFGQNKRAQLLKNYPLGVLSIDDDSEEYDQLTAVEKFFLTNRLKTEKIVSIQKVEAELGDIEVPANNTLVYNGFVSHNTVNYLAFYGGQADRLQETLANKSGLYFSIEDCKSILKKYFEAMPTLLRYLKDLHAKVLNPGYIVTPLGRKKYFTLPPKWQASNYRESLAKAQREAGNAAQQSSNVDCTKFSCVEITETLESYDEPDPGRLLFPVHDEIVTEVIDHLVDEMVERKREIMVRWGSESVKNLVPIEVSVQVGNHWAK